MQVKNFVKFNHPRHKKKKKTIFLVQNFKNNDSSLIKVIKNVISKLKIYI